MPHHLPRPIAIVAMAIISISAAQWISCRFYVLPTVWPWYARWVGTPQGKLIDPAPMGCNDVDTRTITAMMAVLTTLISLSKSSN